MPSGLLSGKVIFVTGGASGIGRDCALAYACEGARVAIADVNLEHARKTVGELGEEGLALGCDVSDGASVEEAIRRTISAFSSLDAVHNNAGISGPSKSLHETSEDEWDRLHEVNLKKRLPDDAVRVEISCRAARMHPEHSEHGGSHRSKPPCGLRLNQRRNRSRSPKPWPWIMPRWAFE